MSAIAEPIQAQAAPAPRHTSFEGSQMLFRIELRLAAMYGASLALADMEPQHRAAHVADVLTFRRAWTCVRWLRKTGRPVEFSGPLPGIEDK